MHWQLLALAKRVLKPQDKNLLGKYLILQSQKIFFEGKGSVLQSNFAILWFVVTTEGLYPNHDVSNVCFSKSKAICVEHFDEFQKQF